MEPRAVKIPFRGLLVEIASGASPRREIDTGEKQLNALNVENRQFSIIQDRPRAGLSVVVAEKGTGTILSSFPAESVLKLLERIQNDHDKTGDGPAEPASLASATPASGVTTILVVEDVRSCGTS